MGPPEGGKIVDTETEEQIEVLEEKTRKEIEEGLRPCSILEYRWATTYSDQKVFEFGKRGLISSDCASSILTEREKERHISP